LMWRDALATHGLLEAEARPDDRDAGVS
jgi:hypothetical protein